MATKKNAAEGVSTKETPEDQLVEVFIPRTADGEAAQYVGINGYATLVPKGKRVKVSPAVAEVINNMLDAENLAYQRQQELQDNSKF